MTLALTVARWLLDAGAGASACRVLGSLRTPEANDVRELSAAVSLRPGIYAMVASQGGGLVVPVRAEVGPSRFPPGESRNACETAFALVRDRMGASLPAMRLELEDFLATDGPSIGLGAALAYTARAAGRSPLRPVVATGALARSGDVLSVGYVEQKLAAAAEEGAAIVLTPPDQTRGVARGVTTFDEAAELAFGTDLVADPELLSIDGRIRRAREEPERQRGIDLLEAIDTARLTRADRARVWLELGTLYRHNGRSVDAVRLHGRALEELALERTVVGRESAERYELEVQLTAMDDFRLDEAVRALTARIREPFLSARNELRFRGSLAQALAMSGRFLESVGVRQENVPLHEQSDELAKLLPGTLCYLALDSARGGDAAGFDHWAERLVAATRPGDEAQWRYSGYALVRGLVVLGRHEHAVGWVRGERTAFGVAARTALRELWSGDAVIDAHPATSTARHLCRASRSLGDPRTALALGARIRPAPSSALPNLATWIARLAGFEIALAQRDLGEPGERVALQLATVRGELPVLHPAASRHHRALLECDVDALEPALDAVYY